MSLGFLENTVLKWLTAYDFLTQVLMSSPHISKNMMNPIGIRLKEISVNTFALASERILSVSKQLSLLNQKVKAG